MKLTELTEDFNTLRSKRNYTDTINTLSKGGEKVGVARKSGGTYSRVYDLVRSPNEILKIGRHPGNDQDQDGYFGYIQHILDLDNPYFPKVDELNQVHSKDGDKYFTVRMEKLHPLHVLDQSEIQAIFSRIFSRPVDDDELQRIMTGMIPPVRRKLPSLWAEVVSTFIENCVETDEYLQQVQDEQLTQAIKLLRQLNRAGFMLDIHDENIMVRRTPYGAHLVLTDPFSVIHPRKQK